VAVVEGTLEDVVRILLRSSSHSFFHVTVGKNMKTFLRYVVQGRERREPPGAIMR